MDTARKKNVSTVEETMDRLSASVKVRVCACLSIRNKDVHLNKKKNR